MSSYAVYVGVGLLVSLYLLAKWRRRMFEEQFPPISDAEFLALCTPGTDPKVALKVRRIVADHFAVEYERVYPSTRFIEDLGAD
ncbi:Uncharacterized protein OS=Pirellula staleyi (strain ATCC 27377 / DSM 6068 / ICPB 4128) GN=Psta_3621 PE=4 SV=1 [Gemmata massiliana]|uniref:Carrier domain-containing protein n=1 Tax=Gemmata massiliana TaxID=1210884 RepID=A0A6P2CXP3_9BACT|nr:hypothetical protein [Gemmata massiliana]VTR91970.1 Uncharacterized protein OS=Pirellula staleyi (strain ATCC 27377 / DSM 6068 / ICPB 4128) GN=Psta_3621 PE=4 SV=1 [Gemmata massiliana]